MFLLYGPKDKLTFQDVPCCCKQSSCFFSIFLRGPCSSLRQTWQHVWYTLNASRPPWSGTDTCLISHVLLPETPTWINTLGNCCIYAGLISLLFWSPTAVFCPVHEDSNTTIKDSCQPLWPCNKPTTSKCSDYASVHSCSWTTCISPCWKPRTCLGLPPLSKELKY